MFSVRTPRTHLPSESLERKHKNRHVEGTKSKDEKETKRSRLWLAANATGSLHAKEDAAIFFFHIWDMYETINMDKETSECQKKSVFCFFVKKQIVYIVL